MKIAVFYENILEIISQQKNIHSEKEVLQSLVNEGLEKLYMDFRLLNENEESLMSVFNEVGLKIEGLYGFYEFGERPNDKSYIEHIDLAARVDAGSVLIVPGFIETQDSDKRKAMLLNMKKALSEAVAYGNSKDVAVTMEDFDHATSPSNSIDGLRWFMENVSGLKCTFDTGNFIISGEDAYDAFKVFKPYTCAVHLKDRSHVALNSDDKPFILPNGKKIYPAPIGQGYIKIKEIINLLQKDHNDYTLIIELFGCSDMQNSIKESIKWVKGAIK
jgi:sugar phosphate isomerase/epimerase